jgi:type IV pilus assembly protein PilN
MRISVNLATRPFVELRPLFARLRLAMGVLALLAIGLGFGLHALNARARAAQSQMDALKAKTHAYEQERLANESRMRQPENRGVLERSQFLNSLFAQKSFSWTAVMMDLEKVLPTGVQVTSLEPQIAKDGGVSIRLRVSGDRERGVQLLRNLETSQRFVAPRLAGEAAQVQEAGARAGAPPVGPGTVEFEILSGYNPLPAVAVKELVKEQVVPVEKAGKRKVVAGGPGGVR